MRISDWSSDVRSSDLGGHRRPSEGTGFEDNIGFDSRISAAVQDFARLNVDDGGHVKSSPNLLSTSRYRPVSPLRDGPAREGFREVPDRKSVGVGTEGVSTCRSRG